MSKELMTHKVPCPLCYTSAWHQGLCDKCSTAIKYKYNNSFWVQQLITFKRVPAILLMPIEIWGSEAAQDAYEGIGNIFVFIFGLCLAAFLFVLYPLTFPLFGVWEWLDFREFLKKKYPECFSKESDT